MWHILTSSVCLCIYWEQLFLCTGFGQRHLQEISIKQECCFIVWEIYMDVSHSQYSTSGKKKWFVCLRLIHECNLRRSQITVRVIGEGTECEGLVFFPNGSFFPVVHFLYRLLSLFIDFLIRLKRFSCSLEREENVGVFWLARTSNQSVYHWAQAWMLTEWQTICLLLLPLSLLTYQLHIYYSFSYELR